MLCSVRTGTDLWAHRVSDTSPGSVWALKVRPGCPCGESERSLKASSRCRYITSESVDNRVLQNGCVGRANRSLEQGASSRRVPQMREGNKKGSFKRARARAREGQLRGVEHYVVYVWAYHNRSCQDLPSPRRASWETWGVDGGEAWCGRGARGKDESEPFVAKCNRRRSARDQASLPFRKVDPEGEEDQPC